jgi:hypothetical protein
MMLRVLVAVAALVVLVPAPVYGCQYVEVGVFAEYDQAKQVVLGVPGPKGADGKVELVLSRALKGAAPPSVRVKTFEMCDVSFVTGQPVLVFLDGQGEVVNLGNGVVQKPSDALLAALAAWSKTPATDRLAMLHGLFLSADAQVAHGARVALEVANAGFYLAILRRVGW